MVYAETHNEKYAIVFTPEQFDRACWQLAKWAEEPELSFDHVDAVALFGAMEQRMRMIR